MDKCIYNGKVVNSFDIAADLDIEMEIRQSNELRCCNPACDMPVRYRHGKIRIPHFAHIETNKECDYDRYSSKKSDMFKNVQQEIYTILKRKYPQAVNIDIKLIKDPSHYTPIILKGRLNNFAIDITDKRITANTLQIRKEAYTACGYKAIQIIIDEAGNYELSESDDMYLPVRYELNKSANNSAVVYDKNSEKYYYLRYDNNKYDKSIYKTNVISREFSISELTITAQGISVPRLEKEYAEWVEERKNRYQKYLESSQKVKLQRLRSAVTNAKKLEYDIESITEETSKKLKPLFDPIEFHKQTGKYAGNVVNGIRESKNLNEIHIKKSSPNYFKVFSDSEIEKLINDAFDFSITNIVKLMNKMYQANAEEKSVFIRIYEEYLNAEQTDEVTERLKVPAQ